MDENEGEPPVEEKEEVAPVVEEEEVISMDEIPLDISVEVGKVRMQLDKLLELEAGNLVELPMKPEEGVQLTVGGKVVAKGELLKVGDVLGVRITKIEK